MIDPQTLALCEAETQETFLPAPDALAPADRDKLLSYLDRLGENEAAMKRQIAELGRALLIMDNNNRKMQRLIESRLTVTTAQERALTRAVAARAKALCDENGLEYAHVGRAFRDAIYKDIRNSFAVPAVGDVPAVGMDTARTLIAQWSSFRLARKLRDREREKSGT